MVAKRSLSVSLFIVGFLFFVGALLDVGSYYVVGPGIWRPSIECRDSLVDLGKLPKSEPFPVNYSIRNTGNRPLVISRVSPSCSSCVRVISFPNRPILPGGEGVISVTLLTGNLPEGAVKKSVTVFSNDPLNPALVLKMVAQIRQASRDLGATRQRAAE